MDRFLRLGGLGCVDTSETVYISSLALLKMLKHGRAGVPMEVMGLMLGEFVDDYTVNVIDVFAMPQSGTGVSVEAVDPVFQAKMLDMLRQTGRPEMVVWISTHKCLQKPSIQALIHGLNRHYYSIPIAYHTHDLEQKMLLNLNKLSWMDAVSVENYSKCGEQNKDHLKAMLKLAKNYKKALEDEKNMTDQELAIKNVGKIDSKRHVADKNEQKLNVPFFISSFLTFSHWNRNFF
ncbi:unnamed protein product [Caenorhabditis brenneri]